MASASGVKQNGLCTTSGSTSYLLVSGTGLAVTQPVRIQQQNVTPVPTWTGTIELVNPAGTVWLAVVSLSPPPPPSPPVSPSPKPPGPAAATAQPGGLSLPTGLPKCSVVIDGGVATTLNIDLYT